MITTTYTAARKNLKNIFDTATDQLVDITITRRNGKNVVIMSEEEYLGWQETTYLLSNPNNAKHLQKSIKELDNNDTTSFELDEL